MFKAWGNWTIKGGFSMSTKRDLFELIAFVVYLLFYGGIAMTGHNDASMNTVLSSGLTGFIGYWIAKAGYNTTPQQTVVAPSIDPAAVQTMVNQAITQAVNTPAQQVNNGNQIPSNGIR